MNYDEVRELLGAFALDAVDDDERAEIEQYLREHPELRAEVQGYREAAAQLAGAGDPPSSDIWQRVSQAIAGASISAPRLQPKRVFSWRVGIAAGFAALIGVVSLSFYLQSRIADLERTQGMDPVTAAAAAVISDPTTRIVTLTDEESATVGRVVIAEGGRSFIFLEGVDPVDASHTYQLWSVADGGTAVSVGLLGADPGPVAINLGAMDGGILAVTVEAAGGATAPTGSIIAQGDIPQA